jgi:hypothetical protein
MDQHDLKLSECPQAERLCWQQTRARLMWPQTSERLMWPQTSERLRLRAYRIPR